MTFNEQLFYLWFRFEIQMRRNFEWFGNGESWLNSNFETEFKACVLSWMAFCNLIWVDIYLIIIKFTIVIWLAFSNYGDVGFRTKLSRIRIWALQPTYQQYKKPIMGKKSIRRKSRQIGRTSLYNC